jgi:basic membrane lipoprotein Med (substrate-binding protein (PBP1-ABC) superfamily)
MVIGVDTDQRYLGPSAVITSMRKRIDRAVLVAVEGVVRHSFAPGTIDYGVGRGGVDYVVDPGLPPGVVYLADSAAALIRNGDLIVPCGATGSGT